MIDAPNSHLILHKEQLKQHLENRKFNKSLVKIINLGAINGSGGWNGLVNNFFIN